MHFIIDEMYQHEQELKHTWTRGPFKMIDSICILLRTTTKYFTTVDTDKKQKYSSEGQYLPTYYSL